MVHCDQSLPESDAGDLELLCQIVRVPTNEKTCQKLDED